VPQLRGDAPENVLLGCTPHAASRAVVGAPIGDHWMVEVERDGALVATGTGALEPGRYHVRVDRLEETATDVVERRVLSGPIGVRAGEWLDLRREIDRRAAYGLVEVTAAARASDEMPDLAAGLGLWWAARDGGDGRLALGLAARASSGPAYHVAEAGGRIGWWWTFRRPRIDLGPVAGFAAFARSELDVRDGTAERTRVATIGTGGLRAQVTRGPAVLALEGGAQILRLDPDPEAPKGTVRALDLAPSIGVAVGVAL
jgi:hypothetical protein